MTLEERLRAYAAKGELVHLSILYSATDSAFVATFAAASQLAGYSYGRDADPVLAIEAAFKSVPVRASRAKPITAAVSEPEPERVAASLPTDWTKP